jgi:hypothetical protein
MVIKKKEKNSAERWMDYYDRGNILDELIEKPVEFSLDHQLLRDILGKNARENFKMSPSKWIPFK